MFVACLYGTEPLGGWVQQVELGNSLVESGHLEEAETVYTKVLHEAQTTADNLAVGVVLQNLGRLLDRRGQLRDAERAYLEGVNALNKAGITDDRLMVRAYVGLPPVYIQTGQDSKAETLIRRVLARHPKGADADKASLMGSLGVVLAHKQRWAEAEQVLRMTAQLCATSPDPKMQEVGAVATANLAGLQMREGRIFDAIESYRYSVVLMEAVPAPSPTTLAVTLADYATAVRTQGDVLVAENLYRRAITVAETRLGPNHVILAEILHQYAELVRNVGRKSEARKLVNAAQQIRSAWNRANMTGHTIEVESLR